MCLCVSFFDPILFKKKVRVEDNKKIIKDDINFLEYPNWVIDRKNKATTFSIEKPHGKYEIISPLGLPKHFDKIILYCLLYKLYREKNFESYLIKTSRYEIAKNVFSGVKDFGKNKFNRIMVALKKWNALSINFDGLFYSNEERSVRYFHIVDEVTLRPKSGELTVKFNESYVKQLRETTFYKLIDFEQYKKLHKTSSARLYEILVKNFKDRKEWSAGIQLLAEKLTFEKRQGAQNYYPSDVLRYLKPSVNEINKKTDLEIKFDYNNETSVCVFKLVKKQKVTYTPATKSVEIVKQKADENAKLNNLYMKKFKLLSVDEQKEMLEAISRDAFLKVIDDQDHQIVSYMMKTQQYKILC